MKNTTKTTKTTKIVKRTFNVINHTNQTCGILADETTLKDSYYMQSQSVTPLLRKLSKEWFGHVVSFTPLQFNIMNEDQNEKLKGLCLEDFQKTDLRYQENSKELHLESFIKNHCYLINFDRCEYVSLDYLPSSQQDLNINPLPLLCYNPKNDEYLNSSAVFNTINSEMVGLWAGNRIGVSNTLNFENEWKDFDLKEIFPNFTDMCTETAFCSIDCIDDLSGDKVIHVVIKNPDAIHIAQAKTIDGDEYSESCFGTLFFYDSETKKVCFITEMDGVSKSVFYYIDNEGYKHYLKGGAISQAFLAQLKEAILKPSVINSPFTEEDIEFLMCINDGNPYLTAIVEVDLSDLIDNNLEEFLDLLSIKVIGSTQLMNINYEATGVNESNQVLIKVTGDFSLF